LRIISEFFEGRFCSGNVPVSLGNGENVIQPKCAWLLTVFVKKSYLSSWVFPAMQSVHIRMNSSLSTPKKILDPPMHCAAVLWLQHSGTTVNCCCCHV